MTEIHLCECGCGEPTRIAKYDDKRYGTIRGKPYRFIRNHHQRKSPIEYLVDPSTNCWIWQRFIRKDGYGEAHIEGERGNRPAHRVIYERIKGKILEGLDLDHLCRNRSCVNPDHLEPVTRKENLSRGVGGFNNFSVHYEKMKLDSNYKKQESHKRIKGRDQKGRITNGKEN